MDYVVESASGKGGAFRVKGDWPGEVMGVQQDGTPKDYWLYKPGDVFIVREDGWLHKVDEVTSLYYNYEEGRKKNGDRSSASN